MPMIRFKDRIPENSSYDINFECMQLNGTDALPLSDVKVYIMVAGHDNEGVWVNSRNGTSNTGLVLQSNEVSFHLLPADNAIVDRALYAKSGCETHIIRFELIYDAGLGASDKAWVEWWIEIFDMENVT